jgi:hypothetical protein
VRGKGRIVGCGDKKFTKLNINDATLNWSGGGEGSQYFGILWSLCINYLKII